MAEIIETALPGVVEIIPARHGDDRGFFSETWHEERWQSLGISSAFCQDNHSFSKERGVLRGLHFQRNPMAQDKLVRAIGGVVFDVAVDIRKGSPTYGQWAGVELDGDKGNQFFIPRGFAHGFLTLTPNTHFLYKVSAHYSPQEDRSVRFDDPDIDIEWPIEAADIILSDKDRNAPLLRDSDNTFTYSEEE